MLFLIVTIRVFECIAKFTFLSRRNQTKITLVEEDFSLWVSHLY